MNEPKIVHCRVHFERAARGRKRLQAGADEQALALPPGRVPRLARLLALALRLEGQLRQGVFKDCAALACLGQVSRSRVSQILSLVHLAPNIQEAILFLPRTQSGRDPVILRDVLPLAAELDWKRQRRKWRRLLGPA
jgi:hypothetical protein